LGDEGESGKVASAEAHITEEQRSDAEASGRRWCRRCDGAIARDRRGAA